MRADGERWDARYAGRTTGEPAPPDGLDRFDSGRLPAGGTCLDVACGLGAQSLWAALGGFDVVALDASPAAVSALRDAAARAGVNGRIDARTWDLDDGLPPEVTGGCALVICQRFRQPSLYPALADALAPGGLVVVTVLSQVGLSGAAGEYHAPPGELAAAFDREGLDIVRSYEGGGEATLVARRVA